MGSNSNKNSQIQIINAYAHLHIIKRNSTKFSMNPMKDAEGVEETRFLTYKVYVSMGINSVKNSIKTPKPHANIHISIISNESVKRCRSYGDKVMLGKV